MAEAELRPPRHERRDVRVRWLALGLGLVLPLLGGIALVPRWLYPHALDDATLSGSLPLYPGPRLQTDTRAAMDAWRVRDRAALDAWGWTDQAAGVAHVPVAEAMKRVAAQGIPDWPTP